MKTILLAAVMAVSTFGFSGVEAQPPTFKDGVHLVNEQIPPGLYRSMGKGARCYWERTAESGDILANDLTSPGGAVMIQPADYKFQSNGCGTWMQLDPTALPAQPIEKQTASRKDGHSLVNVDMAPGLWWSNGMSASCYWERLNSTQDINGNHFGYGGGAVMIRPDDFEFYSRGCGAWTMLDTNNLPALSPAKQAAAKRDGIYIIGLNMTPGRWRSNGSGMKCYWEKSDRDQEIIDNHLGEASVIVNIEPMTFEFYTTGCGTWTLTQGNGVGTPLEAGQAAPAAVAGSACPTANVCIVRPASGTRVARGNVLTFSGTATGDNFARYQFQAGVNDSWGHIADFQKPVVNGDLMELHTDTLPPGTYKIRLQVIDNTGNAKAEKAEVVVTIE
ncbi:MAG: hypothetical protein NTZ50_11535 [Chloroflexi bacterium]|nr:hypothetical protein [Chloroflexota bacterium]